MDVSRVNEQLRAALKEAGWTHDAAARAVNRIAKEHGESGRTNKSSITHWINGVRPHTQTVTYLVEALSRKLGRQVYPFEIGYGEAEGKLAALPENPVAALVKLGRADVDRRQVLGSAVYSLSALLFPLDYRIELGERAERAASGGIGRAEVDAVTDITAAFNRADEKLGGGFGRTAVVEYLTTDVATYCGAASQGPIRSAMFSAAAQLAYLSGWKAHDIGREALAQHYYVYSYQLAIDSGDLGQAAYVMRILAHQAYDMGHHGNCLDLALGAVRTSKGKVDSHTAALLTLTVAKAHAMRGERRQGMAAINEAEATMAKASPNEERPGWAGLHGLSPAQFNNHVAKTLVDLRDYSGAEEHFKRSLTSYLDPVTQPRIYALATTWLAEVQCRRGHVEQACQTWIKALGMIGGIQSSRTTAAVMNMKQMLTPYRRRGVPGVQRLLATTLGS